MSRTIYDKTGVPITIAETMVIDVDMAINDTLSLVGYGFGGYQDHYEEHKIIFAFAKADDINEMRYGVIGGLDEVFTSSLTSDIQLELNASNTLRYVGNNDSNPAIHIRRIVIIY